MHAAPPPATASTPPELPAITHLSEFWAIPDAQKNLRHPFRLELTALYYDLAWKLLWVNDGSLDSYLPLESTSPRLKSGQHFILEGELVPSAGLPLATARLTILPDTPRLQAIPATADFANSNRLKGHLVVVEGLVNSQSEVGNDHLQLELAVDGHPCTAYLPITESSPIPQAEGSVIRATGVYVPERAHPNLWIPSTAHFEILQWLDHDPRFTIPVTPIDQLPSTGALAHVVGVVQSQKPGEQIVLRDNTGQVTVLTAMLRPLAIGTKVEAIGHPTESDLNTVLASGLYRPFSASLPAAETARGLPILRLVEQVRRLDRTAADHGYATRLRAVVTWSSPASDTIFVLDSSGGLAVTLPPGNDEHPAPGTRLEITGRSKSSGFAPALTADSIQPREWVGLPPARSVTLEQALTGAEEGQWIQLTGFVRALEHRPPWNRLALTTPAGEFTLVLPETIRTDSLLGAVVHARGICRAITDDAQQLTGIELWANYSDDVVIDEPKPADPFDAPLLTIASLRQFNAAFDTFNHRVRVSGIVVHHDPGVFINLQDGAQSLLVLNRDPTLLQPGERLEIVGFPGRQGHRVVLRESIYRRVGHGAQPEPAVITAPAELRPQLDGRLVRIDAQLANVGRRGPDLRLICQAEGTAFEAVAGPHESAGLSSLATGSRVAITGVYLLQFDQNSQPRAFELQLRSARDVVVLESPLWWTSTRARAVMGSLAAAVLLGVAWVVSLRRRVARQTAQIRDELEKSARLEAELVRSSKLESLGVLAGGIAHDFNNLLTVVLGNISLVLSDRKVLPEDEHCLHESERAALRARDLTQQLLTFAKGGDPVRSAVLLPDIIREATAFALHGSRVRSDFDFVSGLWAAHVDRGQISQVVHNIVINAMHAMPAGGAVKISLRNESVVSAMSLPLPEGRYLHLTLRDSGTGISPNHLSRIFDPYFTTKQQGSGLGLATVYSIVKKHAGHISVDSVLGQGTTFHIWLPAASSTPVSSATAAPSTPRLTGRVLFMDDEPTVREMGVAMLRRLGLDVTAVPDGAAAIREYTAANADRHPFSAVILDLTVPGAMGGAETAAELRRLDPAVRLIVSSGYSNDPIVARYKEHGFHGRVPKPYVFDQFAKVVASAIDGGSAGTE